MVASASPQGGIPSDEAEEATRPAIPRVLLIPLLAALLVALVRLTLVQSFVVPTGSMEETVRVGDRVLVSRLAYRFGDVRRGDVVVFDGTGIFTPQPEQSDSLPARLGRGVASALGVPVGRSDYLKRVIGLPGERVVCCDAQGRLTVDGVPLEEPYLHPGDEPSVVEFDVVVPEGRVFVMGDHRSDSADSRAHLGDPGGGTVPLDRLVGRVVAVYWPFGHAERLHASSP